VQLRNSRIKNASHFLDYGIQSLLGWYWYWNGMNSFTLHIHIALICSFGKMKEYEVWSIEL
jgi:hypothetical protein